MKNKKAKIGRIIEVIKKKNKNFEYRYGPELYFYKKILKRRNESKNIINFLNCEDNIELCYTTLLSWDMNSRGAKMKYFDNFKNNILDSLSEFKQLEFRFKKFRNYKNIEIENINEIINILKNTYYKLDLMISNSKLVANSKLLHYLFPYALMPMDRNNTMKYFYGNTGVSIHKYLEVIEVSFNIMEKKIKWSKYLNTNEWNTTVPKIIDNAIIHILKN